MASSDSDQLAHVLSLLSDLGEVESDIERLKTERDEIRNRLSELVAVHFDNKATVPGYGTVALRAPSVAKRWDSGALDELIQSLRETGQGELADEIAGCKKVFEQAGGLVIRREKEHG